VVDLDLEKFFDRVNHDRLMRAIARRMTDKRVLRLIGAFLKVRVLEEGTRSLFKGLEELLRFLSDPFAAEETG
jgi:retron-type reverse transcriptase